MASKLNLKSLPVRRLLAFCVDWGVIVLWGLFIFLVVVVSGSSITKASGPWSSQAIAFGAMTLPVTLYFALCESSRLRATLGKRWLGLKVVDEGGGCLPLGRSLLRNALKFLPWELGHLVAHQAIFAPDGALPNWVWVPVAISWIGPLWWIVGLVRHGRAPYDSWTRARVIRTTEDLAMDELIQME